jgi:hypothetical protein
LCTELSFLFSSLFSSLLFSSLLFSSLLFSSLLFSSLLSSPLLSSYLLVSPLLLSPRLSFSQGSDIFRLRANCLDAEKRNAGVDMLFEGKMYAYCDFYRLKVSDLQRPAPDHHFTYQIIMVFKTMSARTTHTTYDK